MKNLLTIAFSSLAVCLTVVGCDSLSGLDPDTSMSKGKGSVVHDGTAYKANTATLYDYGYLWDDNTRNYGLEFEGSKAYITFSAYADGSSASFPAGTYSMSESHEPGTFDSGSFTVYASISDWDPYIDLEVTEGTLAVERSGDRKYAITFECTLSDGKTMTGSYEGELLKIEE